MENLVPLGTGNSRFMKSNIPANTTLAQLIQMLNNGTFPYDIGTINPAGISQQGTPLNKDTLLKDATAALYELGTDAVPDDVFEVLSNAALYEDGKFVFPSGEDIPYVSIETGSYVGTGTSGSSHPNSISLNFKPDFAVIVGNNVIAVFQSELTSTYRSGGGMTAITDGELYARFLNGTLSWYTTDTSYDRARMQCNMQNSRYYYCAIGTTGGAA